MTVSNEPINKTMIMNKYCLGCGHDNPNGYKIEVFAREGIVDELFGTFDPPDNAVGFPGMTHGGAIYTVFDCIAAWVPTVFRPDMHAVWMLREAGMTYHRPALVGKRIHLQAAIETEGDRWEPKTVVARAYDSDDQLLAEGEFTFVPLSGERFKYVSGLEEIPEQWKDYLTRKTKS